MNKYDSLFTSRPHKVETCPRCRGCGSIGVGYALASTQPFVGMPANAIPAFVVGSSTIYEACTEASEIARRAKKSVAFNFNELIVVVGPKDDPVKVARQWWQDRYNETPEQSFARR